MEWEGEGKGGKGKGGQGDLKACLSPSYMQKIAPSDHPNPIIRGLQVQSIRMGERSRPIGWSKPRGSVTQAYVQLGGPSDGSH